MWSKPMHTPQKSRPLRAAQGGFSLIEILIVVALIALIAGMVANQVFGGRSRANVKLAQSDLASLAAKVEQFEMDTGVLPQRLEDLVKEPGNARGWLGPYAKESALRDPWNTPYEYRVPGDGAPFAIISYGDDKKPGGSGVDADLSSAD
jgi:general secretion pathway protein G